MKGRTESSLSLLLERSMNMFCRVQTYEELISYQKALDEQDDELDKKMKGLFLERESMNKCFSKKMTAIEKGNNFLQDFKELKKEMEEFHLSYEKRLNSIVELREHLEKEDDRVRQLLEAHTEKCHKRLREENHKIESTMILENLNKKKLASVVSTY